MPFRLVEAVLPAATFSRSDGFHAQSVQTRHVVGLDPCRRSDCQHRCLQLCGSQQVRGLLITIDLNEPDVRGVSQRLDHGIGIAGHGRHPDAPMAPWAVAPRHYQGLSVAEIIVALPKARVGSSFKKAPTAIRASA